MADIYDLAQSINRRRQQASQGYSSGWEDLPLQVMKIMDTRAKEKRVSLKNDSIILSQLIGGATSEDEINNALKVANQYGIDASSDPETQLYGNLITQKASQRRDEYNQFKASAEWIDNQLKEEGGMEYFEMSEEELMSISPEELTKRMDEVASFSGGMRSGLSNKFKYRKGAHSLDKINKTFAEYEQKLEDAIAANVTGKKITQEEAMAIMLGDYEGAKKTAEATINKNITNYNSQLKQLRKERLDIKSAMAEGGEAFAQYAANAGMDASGIQSYLAELDENISDLDSALTLEYDRQYYWTGIGRVSGEDDFRSNVEDDGTGSGTDTGDGSGTGDSSGTGGGEKDKEIIGTKGGEQQALSKTTEAPVVDKKTFTGSEAGSKIFDIRENVSNIVSPYKDKLKDAIESSPEFKKTVFSQSDTTRQKQKKVQVKSKDYKNQIGQIDYQLKELEEKELKARAQTQASPNNKYYKKQLDQILKKKRNLEVKKLDIGRALEYTEEGLVGGDIEITDEDLFNLIAGGNLKLKELGIPNNVIIEIKKAMKNYKNFIPHVSKNERMEYNFPNKINLNF